MQKEIPILLSTLMVQATLAERKTKTRRTRGLEKINCVPGKWRYESMEVNDKGDLMVKFYNLEAGHLPGGNMPPVKCPYGKPGDLLWVRETFLPNPDGPSAAVPVFKADFFADEYEGCKVGWKPSIHMPKCLSRIWLRVKDVRVERLHDISEEDARSEGVEFYKNFYQRNVYRDYMGGYTPGADRPYDTVGLSVTSFSTLWEKINGRESWESNPWVWVVEFEVLSVTGRLERGITLEKEVSHE